jgi:translation initiation factor IF-1
VQSDPGEAMVSSGFCFCSSDEGRFALAKEDILTFEGRVQEVLPDARYRVELDNGHILVAYTAGRMKKNRIKTLVGDRVTVEVTPYDLDKGRLIFRHKGDSPPPMAGGARPFNRRR